MFTDLSLWTRKLRNSSAALHVLKLFTFCATQRVMELISFIPTAEKISRFVNIYISGFQFYYPTTGEGGDARSILFEKFHLLLVVFQSASTVGVWRRCEEVWCSEHAALVLQHCDCWMKAELWKCGIGSYGLGHGTSVGASVSTAMDVRVP
jgi:hypothetical protein